MELAVHQGEVVGVDTVRRAHAAQFPALGALRDAGRLATARRIEAPGDFRRRDVVIRNSGHVPPPPHAVPGLVEALCGYVNAEWRRQGPTAIGALLLWRINWIHPFRDGNGRTARQVAAQALGRMCAIDDPAAFALALVHDRPAYYDALRDEDARHGPAGPLGPPGLVLQRFVTEVIKNTGAPGKSPVGAVTRLP